MQNNYAKFMFVLLYYSRIMYVNKHILYVLYTYTFFSFIKKKDHEK